MNQKQEKKIILLGIEQLKKEIFNSKQLSAEMLDRYHTLLECLVKLSWNEVGVRSTDKSTN